ncbi:uncharacterized protein LOC131007841 [Salvia miltiorrhiza]|uniref:uncharacterized protein LOC131007841 n=1 Tax=Salvia miltiorrhiza TaxID=226208 RepID=UPI0025AC4059|nr:uncharacterized protein LOC131007841 [Salvia miltiorrhiza]
MSAAMNFSAANFALVTKQPAVPKISSNFNQPSREKPVQIASRSPSPTHNSTRVLTVANNANDAVPVVDDPKPSYAAIMGQRKSEPAIPAHNFSALKPDTQGDIASFSIPLTLYQKQVSEFSHAIIGRVLLKKGEKPKPCEVLKQELHTTWQIQNPWRLIPMGKGFFTMKFSAAEDKARVRKQEISSLCHIWVRIYYLPVECWHPEIIVGIARYLGLPIKIDSSSAKGEFGHYARVLVEVDLALPLHETLLVHCDEGSFYVEFSYEQLPLFCSKCRITGHSLDKCKKATTNQEKGKASSEGKMENKSKENEVRTHLVSDVVKPQWVAKHDDILTDNRFHKLTMEETDPKVLVNLDDEEVNKIEENLEKHHEEQMGSDLSSSEEEDVETIFDEKEENNNRLDNSSPLCLSAGNKKGVEDAECRSPSTNGDKNILEKSREMTESTYPNQDETRKKCDTGNGHQDHTENSGGDNFLQIIRSTPSGKETEQQKKRGRPPKNEKRKPMNDSGIKGRLRKNDQKISSQMMDYINQKLSSSIAAGHQPRDYTIVNAGNPSARSMHNLVVVNYRWTRYRFSVAIVHGSNDYIQRRQLWNDILSLNTNPIIVAGDFNAVKGAHERSSDCLPNAASCQDFCEFISSSRLIESPTVGLKFTWSGRKFMPSHVESLLDRDLVRQSWMKEVHTRCPIYLVMVKLKRLREELKTWNKTVFGNVNSMISDAQQELLEIQNQIATSGYTSTLFDQEVKLQAKVGSALARKNALLQQKCRVIWLKTGIGDPEYDQDRISQHIVEYFSTLFEDESHDQLDFGLLEAVLDPVITNDQNQMLVRIPTEEEITAAVFGLDSNSSSGPDGFPGKFFQNCWAIIKGDIWEADVVSTVADLRPIVLSNFFFKIISKILASRLGEVASVSVSRNQFGFISGRSIHDCITLGSEGVNCMKRTSGGVNMACKIDIKKAFDTLRWDFLLSVLKVSGYDGTFIRWIEIILHSARLSILYNGRLHGYFSCSRGVRQGDPLSPILFGIAEDFLSVLFKNCVTSSHLSPMVMSRENPFPTHLFYADDILVFCKASVRNAETIKHILEFYGSLSGQICSSQKSYIYFLNRVTTPLRRAIGHIINFPIGNFPFIYLGVPLFVGKVRASYLRSIHDRIINKFSTWRGRHLSMAGRICLVKSVIQSSLTHSMMVYRWPKSLIKELDGCCRNFIWTGDTKKAPSCPVAWARVCAIKEEGGLGIRSFSLMNKCFLMKRAWNIIGGQDFGMEIMRKRYLTKFGQVKLLTAPSSVWIGLRQEISPLINDSYCCLGNGADTNFWTDDWIGYQIARKCGVPHYAMEFLNYSVADYFYDGIWHFTSSFIENFLNVVCDILLIPIGDDDDIRLWKPSLHGKVTAALAFAHHCHHFPKVRWGSWLWESFIPTRRSLVVWRILHNRLPTVDRLIKQGMITPNVCPFCLSDEETISHIFWTCARVRPIWQELLQWFNMSHMLHDPDIGSVLVDSWQSDFSSQVEAYWKAGVINLIWFLWRQRNLCIFEDDSWDYRQTIKFIRVSFLEIEQNFTKIGHMKNTWDDLRILRNIGIKGRAAPPPDFINVY